MKTIKKARIKMFFLAVFICFFAGFSLNAVSAVDNSCKEMKQSIPIAMALDDGYTYPTIVSMTSILENASKNTKYDFYIMHSKKLNNNNKNKIKSLSKKYNNCKITFLDMKNEYINAYNKGHITTAAYYRLSLPEILPDIDKILWLDGDILVFKDLTEMYNLNVGKNYCLGVLDDNHLMLKRFGVKCDRYICSGVMVMNLKAMRKDGFVAKSKKFIKDNNNKLNQHDQTVINYVCRGKIGKLHPKFGIFEHFATRKRCREYIKYIGCKDKYTLKEMIEAADNLVIVHCIFKPWKNPGSQFRKQWWNYAKKTDFYSQMAKEYSYSTKKGVKA